MRRAFLCTGVFLFPFFYLNSSPLFFLFQKPGDLSKKIEVCYLDSRASKFKFQENHFLRKNLKKSLEEIQKVSLMNGKNRMNFHDCLHSLKLSEKESMHLKRAFTAYKELFFETLENYNRWLFSIQKEIPVTKDDLQKFSDFYRSKYRIYKLLFLNSESLLENESSSSNPKLSDFQNLYHSLYRLHFSFYSSLKPEIRNRILNKLSNSPKSSDGIN